MGTPCSFTKTLWPLCQCLILRSTKALSWDYDCSPTVSVWTGKRNGYKYRGSGWVSNRPMPPPPTYILRSDWYIRMSTVNGTHPIRDSTLNGHHDASKEPLPQIGRRIFVYSHPRTASNLFCKLFSKHPQLVYFEYPFLRAYFHGPDAQAFLPEGTEELKKTHDWMRKKVKGLTYQSVLDKMEKRLAEAEKEVRAILISGWVFGAEWWY